MSSYIATLPSEILSQILRHHFMFVSSSFHKSNLYAPTRVCRLWRETALNDPFNWASVEIAIDLDHLDETISAADSHESNELERAIQRVTNEARWRLSRVNDVPVDLKISFPHIYRESEYDHWDLVLDMARKFLQESFGAGAGPTSPRVKLRIYEEKGSFHSPVPWKGFFFSDVISMMQPKQYSKLCYLAVVHPDVQDPVTFPNLSELRIFLDWGNVDLLSRIVGPRLRNLQIFSHPDPGDQEVHINTLLTRFPCLTTLALNGSLSSTLALTSRPQSAEQMDSPILAVNILNPIFKSTSHSCTWQLSSFLQTFPNLQLIIFWGNTSSCDEDEEKLVISKKVFSVGFVDHLDNTLARQLPQIFPNLTDLRNRKGNP